ncbi:ATP-binding protein [Rugosimonospora africana]|uniref:Acetyl/propionyl-CoA carboxylase subuit alpha n=1 Tax=Rugosimonospora africana TaxID=556532 RepID=A0A8J3QWK6_9ACTN|nr:biotin carboxylase N-terminal domain-containing protein [Rugosimonospora africana]GIH18198.1 acetyl/propionyl-CoA carboxylase subuit alpha [Rugosimonospora africana]
MIRRLLVANRGEIARRVFATCRAMGIETVAVYSDPDAGASHTQEADRAVRLPGDAAAATYLRADLLVEAALRAGADAVHPGYGFLSENAGFAETVLDAGLTWVGPPAKAIAAMGSKLEAKRLLADAGVPMLPSTVDPAHVTSFPVLVKASSGGGGRGMRIVRDPGELAAAVDAARREAAAAFGDGTVFCERYVERGRHIEVQVFADSQGNTVALGERECSIQRRHQKIIEEAPSPAVTPELRRALYEAATGAAQAVGYVGAGTVEFLLDPSGEFYFLEMNTRLQVEHPVTEGVLGIDLVRLQLLVAEGAPLPFTEPPPVRGHAIEARLYAEDPAHDWRPSTGTLHRFEIPGVVESFRPADRAGLRLDSGVAGGSVIPVHYDPMLAKLIAWAPSRAEAARLLAAALASARVHGVVTNRDLLVRVLREAEFGEGGTDTGFLDRHPETLTPLVSTVDHLRLPCLAAALASAAGRASARSVAVPSGWRNVPSAPQVVGYDGPAGPVQVSYRLDRTGALAAWSVLPVARGRAGIPDALSPPSAGEVAPDAGSFAEAAGDPVTLVRATPDSVVLEAGGVRTEFAVHRVGDVSYVDGVDGCVTLVELPRYPLPEPALAEGSLVAPLPGAVGKVLVEPGQKVDAGALLLTLEAMKLEHQVCAPGPGVVTELLVQAGSQVDTGTVLAVITPE